MTKKNPAWKVPTAKITRFEPKKHRYCLCIPIINEGGRFQKQLQQLKPYTSLVDILICDGGSTDNSTELDFLKRHHVTALLVKKGPGKLSAQLRMGYAFALEQGYRGVITMDGNGKDGADALPLFVEALDQNYDYVQGSRFIAGGKAINTPLIRHLANRWLHAPLLSLAAGYFWFTDTTNGFRAYSQNYLLDHRVQPFREVFQNYELLAYLTVRAAQLGYAVKELPVTRQYPKGTVPTKISFWRGNTDLLLTLMKTIFGRFNP